MNIEVKVYIETTSLSSLVNLLFLSSCTLLYWQTWWMIYYLIIKVLRLTKSSRHWFSELTRSLLISQVIINWSLTLTRPCTEVRNLTHSLIFIINYVLIMKPLQSLHLTHATLYWSCGLIRRCLSSVSADGGNTQQHGVDRDGADDQKYLKTFK